jgi:carbonic anhydrase/acetyltransferase-like protein (isoleucine patch superfamily)
MKEFEARVLGNLRSPPEVSRAAFIAPGAQVIGRVVLGKDSSIWYGAVLRGDIEAVYVGDETNIQDLAVLHNADDLPCRIGNRCTIGHSAIVHACTIGDECLIGMGAIILDGADVGAHCLVGAASMVKQNMKIPEGSLVFGSPAKVIRALTDREIEDLRISAERYKIQARLHGELQRS